MTLTTLTGPRPHRAPRRRVQRSTQAPVVRIGDSSLWTATGVDAERVYDR